MIKLNGNGNNPVGNRANGPPVSDQANGNGNNPVGKEQTQQAPTIAYKSPWSNDMSISSASSSQPLCAHGICSQSSTQNKNVSPQNAATLQHNSSAHASATQTNNVAPQNAASSTTQTTTADPTTVSLTKTFTNTKHLNLRHSFVSNKVVGPDRFRFVNCYWTSSNTTGS